MHKRQIKKTKSKTFFSCFDEFGLIGMSPEEREAERTRYEEFSNSGCRFFHYRDKEKISRRHFIPGKTLNLPDSILQATRSHKGPFSCTQSIDPDSLSKLRVLCGYVADSDGLILSGGE